MLLGLLPMIALPTQSSSSSSLRVTRRRDLCHRHVCDGAGRCGSGHPEQRTAERYCVHSLAAGTFRCLPSSLGKLQQLGECFNLHWLPSSWGSAQVQGALATPSSPPQLPTSTAERWGGVGATLSLSPEGHSVPRTLAGFRARAASSGPNTGN